MNILDRKIGPVPVVYLGGAAVVVLVVVAVKIKPSAAPAEDTGEEPDAAEASAGDVGNTDADLPSGTVIVAPQPVTPAPAGNSAIESNSDWLSVGVAYLTKHGESPGTAQAALQVYLSGGSMTYAQGDLRDKVIREYGLPPDPPDIGPTLPKPVPTPGKPKPPSVNIPRKQGTLPRKHKVIGTGDNTITELAKLYYGNSSDKYTGMIKARNPQLHAGQGIPVGHYVYIPANTPPKYFTSTAAIDTAPEIAKRNGIRLQSVYAWNPGMRFPLRVGAKVRVG